MERMSNRKRGLALTEVLVAMVVMAVGISSLVGLGSQTTRSDFHQEITGVLQLRLGGWLDLFSTEDWTTLSRWASSGKEIDPTQEYRLLYPGPECDLLSNVTSVKGTVEALVTHDVKGLPHMDLARVRVTARWTRPGDRTGTTQAICVERLVADPRTSLQTDCPYGASRSP